MINNFNKTSLMSEKLIQLASFISSSRYHSIQELSYFEQILSHIEDPKKLIFEAYVINVCEDI